MKKPPCKCEVAFSQKCLAGQDESSVSLDHVNPIGNCVGEDSKLEKEKRDLSFADEAKRLNSQTLKLTGQLIELASARLAQLDRRL